MYQNKTIILIAVILAININNARTEEISQAVSGNNNNLINNNSGRVVINKNDNSTTNKTMSTGNNSPAINAQTVNIYNKKLPKEIKKNKESEFALLSKLDISGFHEINRIKKSDISQLLDSVFTFEEHSAENIAIIVNMVDPDNDDFVEPVVTCRRYNNLTLKGFYPKTNWDLKFSSRLNKSCETLKYLLLAEESSVSYIKPILWNRESLKLLPMELSSMGNLLGEPADKSLKTIYELKNRVQIIKREGFNKENNVNVCFEIDESYGICIESMVKADINQDGIEDLIAFIGSYAVEGSHSYGTVVAFTRFDEASPYKISK